MAIVGCVGSTARHEGDFPRDSGHVHRTRYHCTGREERLVLCRSEPSACNREDSAGVICNDGEQAQINIPAIVAMRQTSHQDFPLRELCSWGTEIERWGQQVQWKS